MTCQSLGWSGSGKISIKKCVTGISPAQALERTHTEFGSRSHGQWIGLVRTLDRIGTGCGQKEKTFWRMRVFGITVIRPER